MILFSKGDDKVSKKEKKVILSDGVCDYRKHTRQTKLNSSTHAHHGGRLFMCACLLCCQCVLFFSVTRGSERQKVQPYCAVI